MNLIKSIVSGAGNKFASNLKNDADLVTNPQRRQEFQDNTMKFAADNAGMSAGVQSKPAELALKMLSKAPKPLGISSADAADAMRDTVTKIAKKALKDTSGFKDINNWGIVDDIVKKIEKGKDVPEDIRTLSETLQHSGWDMVNPSKRLYR